MERNTRLRIWAGAEKEGSSCDYTLFVESAVFNENVLQDILKAQAITKAKRIYLGAGNKDIVSFELDIRALRETFGEVVIEQGYENVCFVRFEDFDKVIVRLSLLPYKNVALKTESDSKVNIYEGHTENGIDKKCKKTKMYEEDRLIIQK